MNLRDPQVLVAINALERRAERQESELSLYNTYVDCGVLSEFSDTESQVIYGRRGVGKTHLLHYHKHLVGISKPSARYFIFDCQKLGSGTATICADARLIGRTYAYEFFCELANRLFDAVLALRLSPQMEERAQTAIMAFNDHIHSHDGSLDFRNVSCTLSRVLDHAGIEAIYIALDEFVSVPQEAQPYFAHHLRLVFSSERRIILKIAAVTYQTSLSAHQGEQQIGLEIGADIFSDVDLDGYFLLDENPTQVIGFFSQVLYNHIADQLEWDLTTPAAEKLRLIVSFFFTQERCLQELIRASEGNSRDMLNIFRLAYSEFRRSENEKISVEHVASASRAWYRGAKLENVAANPKDEAFLNYVIQDVIRKRRSRAFMVSYQNARHPILVRLLNLRLLHRMKTIWSHPDRPGEPFHIFVIDYGCYVDLKGTRAEPIQEVFFDEMRSDAKADDLVPLPDRRSIRRIVLSREDMDQFASATI